MNFARAFSNNVFKRSFSQFATRTSISTTSTLFCASTFIESKKKKPKPCCDSKKKCSGKSTKNETSIHEMVTEYYGKTLETSKDLKTSACTTANRPPDQIIAALKRVPMEIKQKFYGCGSPLPLGIEGLTILDLGSGSGQDCYVAAQLVGEEGRVVGVDMTDNQLQVAREYVEPFCASLGYKQSNLEFIKGYIELLDDYMTPCSIDLVISNCVVNLSPRKDQVLQGVWNCLKEGGEFYFSDVYSDRRLSDAVRKHPVLVGECLGGALYIEDFRRLCQDIGFKDPRVFSVEEIIVRDKELKALLGNARFYSITYRLFKCNEMEDKCEDYGQVAVYKGTIPGHSHDYKLDDHHTFETNKPMLVCANTANMIGGKSWLKTHFDLYGDTRTHFGLFDCGPDGVCTPKQPVPIQAAGGCC